jgi:hypothetical protein
LKVLVIGSGAREHTITWKIAQSKQVTGLYVAPGNAGMAKIARALDIKAEDNEGLLKAAKELNIDLTVVGPEQPLANGVVDVFQKNGLAVFGPSQKAAEISHALKVKASMIFKRRTNMFIIRNHPSSLKRTGWRREKGSSSPSLSKKRSKPLPISCKPRCSGHPETKLLSKSIFLGGR